MSLGMLRTGRHAPRSPKQFFVLGAHIDLKSNDIFVVFHLGAFTFWSSTQSFFPQSKMLQRFD